MKRVVFAVLGVLISAPSWAAGGGHMAPRDIYTPPPAERAGIDRPRDIYTPPALARTGIDRPSDFYTPPPSHSAGPNFAEGPLVKPAWKD